MKVRRVQKAKTAPAPRTVVTFTKPSRPIPNPDPAPMQEAKPEKVKTTLLIPNHLYLNGKRRARDQGLSFNNYLSFLVYQDLNPQSQHPVQVNLPAYPGAGSVTHPSVVPINLPRQRNPLDRFGDVFQYKDENDPSSPKISVPWKVIWDYEQYLHATDWSKYPDGKPPDVWTIARRMGLANPDFGLAADYALESGEFATYMKARALAVKRGFTPDDGIPLPGEGDDANDVEDGEGE